MPIPAWRPPYSIPASKFGEPGLEFNTTTKPAAPSTPRLLSKKKPSSPPPGGPSEGTTPSVGALHNSDKKERSRSNGAMNFGYDDIQLRQDIKEIFGL